MNTSPGTPNGGLHLQPWPPIRPSTEGPQSPCLYYMEGQELRSEVLQIWDQPGQAPANRQPHSRADGTVQTREPSRQSHCVELKIQHQAQITVSNGVVVPSLEEPRTVSSSYADVLGRTTCRTPSAPHTLAPLAPVAPSSADIPMASKPAGVRGGRVVNLHLLRRLTKVSQQSTLRKFSEAVRYRTCRRIV